ncbi:MAG: hypothetical protein Q7V88_06210 [Actinomycetota bacterium]|nr:hypothetical protein [Actinomycetota bacterium]
MLHSSTTKRLALTVALAASLGAAFTGSSASADPKQLTAAVGVGSDTTQDVMNAMTGFTNGDYYTPIHSSTASGARQVISFDATPPAGVSDNCITPKVGGPTFARPNGSTGGRRALSRAIDGTLYGSAACGGVQDVSGLVEFARSSSGPASGDTGTDLTYIPFGRDGMSFAYYRAAGSPVASLTRAELTSLFTTGPQVIAGVRIVPCGIQTSSGTYAFWNTVTTASASAENTATTECNALLGRAQENHGDELQARGDALAALPGHSGDQVVIGFSAGSFVSKANGVAPGNNAAALMGSISNNGSGVNLGSPVTGVAPNLVPAAAFFGDSVFGRNVYNVFPTSVITSAFGNDDLKTLFSGPTSALCSATATINAFGFLVHPSCGSTATKGSLISGQL